MTEDEIIAKLKQSIDWRWLKEEQLTDRVVDVIWELLGDVEPLTKRQVEESVRRLVQAKKHTNLLFPICGFGHPVFVTEPMQRCPFCSNSFCMFHALAISHNCPKLSPR